MLVHSTRELVRLNGLDPVVAGPLTDAGATSYHAVRRALRRIHPGGTTVVIGAGGLGSYAIQYLGLLTGTRVVAVDVVPARLAYATELGAHVTMEGTTPDTAGDILALTGGEGADAVFDFVGIDATIATSLQITRSGGAYALVGAGMGQIQGTLMNLLPKDGEVFTFQAPTIADTLDVFALADAGRIRVDVDVFPLDRVAEAYEAMEAGTLRARRHLRHPRLTLHHRERGSNGAPPRAPGQPGSGQGLQRGSNGAPPRAPGEPHSSGGRGSGAVGG